MCTETGELDSQCGRACSGQCVTGRPLAQRYKSLPARGSTFLPGSGRHTSRWTEALMSDCLPRCRYMSGSDHQTCRSCVSLSPCTSAGWTGSKDEENMKFERKFREGAGWVSDFHCLCGRIRERAQLQRPDFCFIFYFSMIYCLTIFGFCTYTALNSKSVIWILTSDISLCFLIVNILIFDSLIHW